jgi:hypothetical protein
VGNDERHMALPKLYGAPAYARPSAPVAAAERPFDPDDLPLESYQTIEEREILSELQARVYAGGLSGDPVGISGGGGREGSPMLRGRPFRLGSLTSRIRGDGDKSSAA